MGRFTWVPCQVVPWFTMKMSGQRSTRGTGLLTGLLMAACSTTTPESARGGDDLWPTPSVPTNDLMSTTSLEVAANVRIPASRRHLRDQLGRAADSTVLNIAEGANRGRAAQVNHLRIAKGSAAETSAILALLQPHGSEEAQRTLRRIGVMLGAMTRT